MDYLLFLLVNAILFLRPSEIFPELAQVRIYETVDPLLPRRLRPGRGGATFDQVSGGQADHAGRSASLASVRRFAADAAELAAGAGQRFQEFFKVVVYYLLLVGIVNTPARLRGFLLALGVFITALTLIAVLRYHEAIMITPPPTVKVDERTTRDKKKDDGTSVSVDDKYFDPRTGNEVIVKRLRGTGIFTDPNDLCLALVMRHLLCLYGLGTTKIELGPDTDIAPLLCLAPMCLFLLRPAADLLARRAARPGGGPGRAVHVPLRLAQGRAAGRHSPCRSCWRFSADA